MVGLSRVHGSANTQLPPELKVAFVARRTAARDRSILSSARQLIDTPTHRATMDMKSFAPNHGFHNYSLGFIVTYLLNNLLRFVRTEVVKGR